MSDHFKIKAVLFDFGGVLMRTEDRRPRAALAEKLGMSVEALENLVFSSESGRAAQLGEITRQQNWEHVVRCLQRSPKEIPALQEAFFAGDSLDHQLVDYIRSLKPRFTTALLSNMTDALRPALQRWGVADAFHHLFISCELGVMKPDARIYQFALDTIGAAPQEAVFVDDFQHNVEAARALGMKAIWFRGREQAIAELEALMG